MSDKIDGLGMALLLHAEPGMMVSRHRRGSGISLNLIVVDIRLCCWRNQDGYRMTAILAGKL